MVQARAKRHHPQTKTTVITSASDPVVSVIILHYRTYELTADCLTSLLAQETAPAHEIIVVDNDSSDGSGAKLQKKFSGKFTLVSAERNLGFGPGNNLGAQHARGRYLFFINSDTLLLPTTLADLIAAADQLPAYGLLSPRVVLKDGQTVQPASFGRTASVWRLLTRRVDLPASYLQGYETVAPVDWVTGAAMLIPQDVWRQVGGFDIRYFMYWEDQDLCRSIKAAGWQIGVALDSTIIHLGGKSERLTKERYRHYDRSQRQFILKHEGIIAFLLFIILSWPWKWQRNRRAR